MFMPLTSGGQLLLFPGVLVFAGVFVRRVRTDRQSIVYTLPLVWAVGLVALYAARLPASYHHGRYVMPAILALITAGMIGTFYIVRWGRTSAPKRIVTRTLAVAAVLIFLQFAFVIGPRVHSDDVSWINEEMVSAAHWIGEHIPPDELLAIHDIGAVGYFTARPILDIAGLVSPEVVPYIHDPDRMWHLLRERDARYLVALPDQIPGHNPNDGRLCPLFTSDGTTAVRIGGPKMTVYALAWDGVCPE
jgi:hypothetical protein